MYLKYGNSLKEDRDVPKIARLAFLSVLFSLDLQSAFRSSAEKDNLRL